MINNRKIIIVCCQKAIKTMRLRIEISQNRLHQILEDKFLETPYCCVTWSNQRQRKSHCSS